MTPVWSTLLGALLLSERVTWASIAGAALIIVGVVLTRTGGARPAEQSQPAPTHDGSRGAGPAEP